MNTDKEKVNLFFLKNGIIEHYPDCLFEKLDISGFLSVLFSRKGVLQLQNPGEEHYYDCHYNAIILERLNNANGSYRINSKIITTELEEAYRFENSEFAITSPITYVGRNRNSKNARLCYGITIDLDGVGEKQLLNFFSQQDKRVIHKPNILVNSGNGLHFYYLFDKPIALFDETKRLLQKLKDRLTLSIWNYGLTKIKEIQYQSIFQGFRVPGSKTKFGTSVTAWHNVEVPYYTIKELAITNYWSEESVFTLEELECLEKGEYIPNNFSLETAKKLYPDWYERRIVRGEAPQRWHIKRDLYDWWLRKMQTERDIVTIGHRYFCMMTLAMYALKCDVPYEELKEDAYDLALFFEQLTNDPENHFTDGDVSDALQAYKESYATFPRETIQKITGIIIPPNKRNKQPQILHLEEARAIRDIRVKRAGKKDWREGNGRKIGYRMTASNSPKALKIKEWRRCNPDSNNKSQCSRDTGIDRKTILKWWTEVDPNIQEEPKRKFRFSDFIS